MCAKSLHVWLFVTPWTTAWQASLSTGFSSKNTGGGCHALTQGIFPTQETNPHLLTSPALAGRFFTTSTKSLRTCRCCCSFTKSCPTLWSHKIAARQVSLSFTISWSLLKFMSFESVMPSSHLILCHPLLLLSSIFPSIRVFCITNENLLYSTRSKKKKKSRTY